MESMFLIIITFLIILSVFGLMAGVSNDAVNFLNSAIGAKVAKYRTIVLIASIGIFAGAATSNGMMDVARHGIMTPQHLTFFEVMCIFLAVTVTNIILLEIFNSLGMPTSTTVSLVFELLGGTLAIALLKITKGATDASGNLLSFGDLMNTEKAISVIFGIFLSVGIAFILGIIVMWIARLVFTFTYRSNGKSTSAGNKNESFIASSVKMGVFGGIAVTCIIWFLLINGLKGSSFMTPELKQGINDNALYIIGGGLVIFSIIMTALSMLRLPILKFVVLLGTFALAMAFAGNDLVNFVGVPITGLESYIDYSNNGMGNSEGYMMTSLMESAQTKPIYLIIAGIIMVLSLVFSKKAHNVIKTSVDLSRQDEGDEMFGSSAIARSLVRSSRKTASFFSDLVPAKAKKWIDSRFNTNEAVLEDGAAFDLIRASVNLILAGLLVAIGTSLKLPLSTTYVTFMVAMGSSLADRAWSRESAVFRITGVISVIGGWFITAGVAFVLCYGITTFLFFGKIFAIVIAIALGIFLPIQSNLKFNKKQKGEKTDTTFKQILQSRDKNKNWELLCEHVSKHNNEQLEFIADCYETCTSAFFNEEYSRLKRITGDLEEHRKRIKRQRRKEIIGLRHVNPILAIERNTWYFLTNNSVAQMLYCLKRLEEPCREHLGNNFTPVPIKYVNRFMAIRNEVLKLIRSTREMFESDDFTNAETIRNDASKIQQSLSAYRKCIIDDLQNTGVNIEAMTVFLNMIQESQELLGSLRHMIRGMVKFKE